MAKRFTVQKRARMKVVGWTQVEKQFAWDAQEYVSIAKPFKPARTPKHKRAGAKPAKFVNLQGGTAPKCRLSPLAQIASWDAPDLLIRNGVVIGRA